MSFLARAKQGFIPYREAPVLANVLLGMAEGFPLTLVLGTLGYWLAQVGVDKTTIGIFAIVSAPYATKFLWSPVLDRMSLGPITRAFGRRRGWLFTIQALMSAAIIGLSMTNPAVDPFTTGVFAFAVAFLSASQDVVIDAYRIEIMERRQYGHGATALTFGYRAAGLLTGVLVLALADMINWSFAIAISPIMLLPGIIAALWIGEPAPDGEEYIHEEEKKLERVLDKGHIKGRGAEIIEWLYEAVVLPFKEFMTRRGWWLVLIFIVWFKVGDAVVVIMTAPFLVELGFTNPEIIWANKTIGGMMIWVGVFAGSFVYGWFGLYRSLLGTIILMMVTNLFFAWLAVVGHDVLSLAIVVAAENFASGLGNVTVIAFLSALCHRAFTATQYALLSSFAAIGRTFIGTSSGYMAENLGWVDFFIGTTLISVPSILLLLYLWKHRLAGPDSYDEKPALEKS